MLDLFMQTAGTGPVSAVPLEQTPDSGSEESTTGPPTSRSHASSGSWEQAEAVRAEWKPTAPTTWVPAGEALAGCWRADKGEAYEVRPTKEATWVCQRKDGKE